MAKLTALAEDWEDWGRLDPFYAVLADPARRDGGWEADRDEFFASGEREVEQMLSDCARLGLHLARGSALDFGCGVGRVTRALAGRYDQVVGVDVSPSMVACAGELHSAVVNARFLAVSGPADVASGPAAPYDLVWSVLVLQHLGSPAAIDHALGCLLGVLAAGGLLVVEIPERVPGGGLRGRLRARSRAYEVLRSAGVPAATLRARFRLSPPMTMNELPPGRVASRVEATGASIREQRRHRGADGIDYVRYFVTRPQAR